MLLSGGWDQGWGQQGHAVLVVSVSSVSGGVWAGRGAGSRVSSFSVDPVRPVAGATRSMSTLSTASIDRIIPQMEALNNVFEEK